MNVYINDGKSIPNDDTCFIIAKGGIYLKKKLDLIESITPVDKISFLEDISTFAKLNIPKIPVKLFENVLAFFKEVYRLYKSESIVLLFYNKNKKKYKIFVPEQTVSGASLKYDPNITIKDHILIGTIHSHANMSAFHSSLDISDELYFDGIHFTIGKISKKDYFDICASISVNGMRVPVIPENYIEGINIPNMFKPIQEKADIKTSIRYTLSKSNFDQIYFKKEWLNKVKEEKFIIKKFDNIFGDFKLTQNIEIKDKEEKTCKSEELDICNNCIHRDKKINMKEIKKIEKEKCENNFGVDYSNFDNLWW